MGHDGRATIRGGDDGDAVKLARARLLHICSFFLIFFLYLRACSAQKK